MTKEELRETVLAQRRAMETERRELLNMQVFERGHKNPVFQHAERVHIYRAAPDEVETMPFIEYAWGIGKEVFVPVVFDANTLEHVRVTRDTEWKPNRFGILEPTDSFVREGAAHFGPDDCVIVPMVAFDRQCHRLGYGKGFYDRFLASTQAVCIGLAYECQRVQMIPTEVHDVQLKAIATEERWYTP